MKRTFSTELAYVFGIVFVALGVVLMEKADFGVSMVVAPAYLLYRWLSPVWSFVTFGMAEYCLQAVLLLVMCLLLRFRVSYVLPVQQLKESNELTRAFIKLYEKRESIQAHLRTTLPAYIARADDARRALEEPIKK